MPLTHAGREPRSVRNYSPRPIEDGILGYRARLVDLIGDNTPDIALMSLPVGTYVWDGAQSDGTPVFFPRPPGAASHWCTGAVAAQIYTGGKEELVLGGPRWSPPGKPKSRQSGRLLIMRMSKDLPGNLQGNDLDRYGGLLAVKSKATGFFRVEKIAGRWWFVTPEGNGFLSAGINHVDYREDYSDAFVDFVTRHLRDWGFNTIGWSQEVTGRDPKTGVMIHSRGWGPDQYARAKMPYAHLIRFTDMQWYVEEEFSDVFSDAFAEKCDRLAKDVCTKLRDDPYLIGFFYADTPNWPLWEERVGREKLPDVARRYYRVIHDAIRRYDKNHLLLGDRYQGDRVVSIDSAKVNGLPDAVLEAMKSTVDVLSVEYYRPLARIEEDLAAWHAVTGKAVLMADSAFLAPTDALEMSPGGPCYVPDQAARGEAYQQHARRLYANPLVIGWHWCAFGRSVD